LSVMPSDLETKLGRAREMRLSIFAIVLLAFGLLLWARFLLVTGHPRTAIAEPRAASQVAGAADQPQDNHGK